MISLLGHLLPGTTGSRWRGEKDDDPSCLDRADGLSHAGLRLERQLGSPQGSLLHYVQMWGESDGHGERVRGRFSMTVKIRIVSEMENSVASFMYKLSCKWRFHKPRLQYIGGRHGKITVAHLVSTSRVHVEQARLATRKFISSWVMSLPFPLGEGVLSVSQY
jgi:hypothetical protein